MSTDTLDMSAMDDALDDFVAEDAATKPAADKTEAKPAADKTEAKPAADKGPAPWEKDLADRGLTDPAYLDYHRDTIQPYVTQLEQGNAEFTKLFGTGDEGRQLATIASNVLAALEDDPVGTLIDIAKDLEIEPKALVEALGGSLGPSAPGVSPESDVADDPGEPDPDEEMRQFYLEERQRREEAAQQEAYDNLVAALAEEVGESFDETKFHIAMRASGGDAREAWDLYTEITGGQPAPDKTDDPADTPPPVMGSGVGSTPAAAVKEPTSIDEALEDWLAEEKASRRGR